MPTASLPAPAAVNTVKGKVPAPPLGKKDAKKSLKGVLVKKKPKAAPTAAPPSTKEKTKTSVAPEIKRKDTEDSDFDGEAEPQVKRRRLSEADT